ncbi:MAG: HD domain-containing protein, partial [Treponema sp.]|nr:HD domain-containing protein [Treponema sp.]
KISDTILNKNGPLTEEEKKIMENHTIIGGILAKKILGNNVSPKMVQMASDVARYHHERWDGKGYPDGLKETEIPVCARIMAVADVFDALISKRVYKDAVSVEEAFVMMKSESGSHFDPEIIDVFMQLHEELLIETSKNS